MKETKKILKYNKNIKKYLYNTIRYLEQKIENKILLKKYD